MHLAPTVSLTCCHRCRFPLRSSDLGAAGPARAARRRLRHYVDRFDAIAEYLAHWQPPALMLWGRHDVFFDLAEVQSWMSDALASVMETKYVYRFWRPETAIHSGDADGNIFTRGDASFAPLIVAPCFPGYGSAHASAAGAAREVLESLYGKRFHFVQLTHASLPDVTLQYHSFRQIAQDIDDARIFGGIHFRFDQQAGARMGRQIGRYVYRNTLRSSQFRPSAQ